MEKMRNKITMAIGVMCIAGAFVNEPTNSYLLISGLILVFMAFMDMSKWLDN
jgi:hypothetical protein